MADKKIFISYRRQDTAGESGRLADSLKQHYDPSQIFMDIDTIEPGVDFVDVINRGVSSCEVLLAIIGPDWVNITDAQGNRRLDDENDFIRLEIATALKRNIRVIPVLVDGAKMPTREQLPADLATLSRRNAHEISNTRWSYDVQQLLKILEKVIGPSKINTSKPQAPKPVKQKKSYKVPLMIIGGLVFVIAVIIEFAGEEDTYEPVGGFGEEAVVKSGTSDVVSSTEESQPTNFDDEIPAESESKNTTYEAGYASVAGAWYENSGSYFIIDQQNNRVSLTEYNAYQVEVGSATGNVIGQEVNLDYYNSLMGLNATIKLTLSSDGEELSGKITESSTGTVMPLFYTRY
ncbi:toll/interleukin-1 receptor domain-containing protein [Catalinimonas sp. 4WD22]|uniref:toll/interleukin-1 receptor domain-containing protein n=1 Tax=Catalinimonas locisalis TaxID=3133978 RepID=UPI00310162E2